MEKSEWVCQATLGCSRSRAPLRNAHSLVKFFVQARAAIGDVFALSCALAEPALRWRSLQPLQPHVGFFDASLASAKVGSYSLAYLLIV